MAPTFGAGATTQPKPAAQQTSEGVAQASPAVWRMLASAGGTMGTVAKQKLDELNPPSYPVIAKRP